MIHLPPSLRVALWTACVRQHGHAAGVTVGERLQTLSGKARNVRISSTFGGGHARQSRTFSTGSKLSQGPVTKARLKVLEARSENERVQAAKKVESLVNARKRRLKARRKSLKVSSPKDESSQPSGTDQALEDGSALATILRGLSLRTLTKYQDEMSVPKQSKYPAAPGALFNAKTMANGVQNICSKLGLSMEVQVGFKDMTLPEEARKQLPSGFSKYYVCDLRLQITDFCDDTATGEGISKQSAKQAAWFALVANWSSSGKWDELYAELEPPKLDRIDEVKIDEVKIDEVDEETRIAEKDAKLEIFNYAASLGQTPRFSANRVRARGRDRPGKKTAKIVKVEISMDAGRTSVSAVGNDLPTAELAAAIKFKAEAERQRQLGFADAPGTVVLSADNAKDFIDFYKSFNNSKIEVEFERAKVANFEQHLAVVNLDERRVTPEPIYMRTKKEAEAVAHLVAAVELARASPLVLAKFTQARSKGNGKVLHSVRAIDLDIDHESLRLMRDGLLGARQAGLPDARDTLEAEELQDSQQRRSPQPLTDAEVKERSEILFERQTTFEYNELFARARASTAALPISQHRQEVSDMISKHVYSIVIGATGSGKTTQVPQILLEEAIAAGRGGGCNIVCTQPRRIAAVSVAQRVAAERGEMLQQSVGYHVRFGACLPQRGGSIKYCTTGILLEQLKRDPHGILDNTSHILIDEVHERDLNIDFLMIVIKNIIKERQAAGKSTPRVVLMSATLDPELFAKYFATPSDTGEMVPCPSISVPGRTFPVREHFLGDIMHRLIRSGGSELSSMRNDPQLSEYLQAESQFSKAYATQDKDKPVIDWRREHVAASSDDSASKALEEKREAYIPTALIATTIAHISKTTKDGAILVFLPGLEEILAVEKYLKGNNLFGLNFGDPVKFRVCLLHSTIPNDEQKSVFDPVPRDCRKIILSTNIAETSVTVADVQHVVDAGKMRETRYDQSRRITRLQCVWESRSNARQRAGRAGRVQDGNYYAMFTKERQQSLRAVGLPELLRSELAETVLQVKASFPQQDVRAFLSQAIEPPNDRAVTAAIANLKAIEAFTDEEQMTDLGRVLSRLPVHPSLGKIMLMGIIYRCLDPMIIFGAATEERSLFMSPLGMRNEARDIHKSYFKEQSDHLALLEAFKELRSVRNGFGHHAAVQRSTEQMLHNGAFKAISQVAEQIEHLLVDCGLIEATSPMDRKNHKYGPAALNENSDNPDLIKALLIAGLHPNLASKGRSEGMSYRTAQEFGVLLHPSSMNYSREKSKDTHPQGTLFAYTSLATSADGKGLFARDTSLVTPLMASLFGGRMTMSQGNRLEVDGWLTFFVRAEERHYAAKMILEFKKAMERMTAAAFRSLANRGEDADASRFATDPAREALAGKVVEVLDQAAGRRKPERHLLWKS